MQGRYAAKLLRSSGGDTTAEGSRMNRRLPLRGSERWAAAKRAAITWPLPPVAGLLKATAHPVAAKARRILERASAAWLRAAAREAGAAACGGSAAAYA